MPKIKLRISAYDWHYKLIKYTTCTPHKVVLNEYIIEIFFRASLEFSSYFCLVNVSHGPSPFFIFFFYCPLRSDTVIWKYLCNEIIPLVGKKHWGHFFFFQLQWAWSQTEPSSNTKALLELSLESDPGTNVALNFLYSDSSS